MTDRLMTNVPSLYPLKFEPIAMSKIWGGTRIYPYKGLPSPATDIGETWELSPMEGHESVVRNGALAGQNLVELTHTYGERLLGRSVALRYGGDFPLLIKMIDANDDLSVQVHPDDEYARIHHGSRGKTEMWYMLDCAPHAGIYAGWKRQTNPDQLREFVRSDAVMDYLALHTPSRGDVFYLPAGKVHTIGAGCLILEIQEASDITYRMYDFDRTDASGHRRELHIDHSAAVLDYNLDTRSSEPYDRSTTDHLVTLVDCPYFHTSILTLTRDFMLPVSTRDSFTILFIEEGEVLIQGAGFEPVPARKGETILLPADVDECHLLPVTATARLLDCFVPAS